MLLAERASWQIGGSCKTCLGFDPVIIIKWTPPKQYFQTSSILFSLNGVQLSTLSSLGFASVVLRHRLFGAQRPCPLFGDLQHSRALIGTQAAYLRWKPIISSCSPINILEPTQRISYVARFQADIQCLASAARSSGKNKGGRVRRTHKRACSRTRGYV